MYVLYRDRLGYWETAEYRWTLQGIESTVEVVDVAKLCEWGEEAGGEGKSAVDIEVAASFE